MKKILTLSAVLGLGATAVAFGRRRTKTYNQAIVDSAYTGLREWNSALQREIVRAHRDARDVCIAALTIKCDSHDAEHMENIERDFAAAVRGSDLLARNDQGEFFVLFPEAGLDEGYEAIERLQEALPPVASLAAGIAVWDHCESAAELASRAVASMLGETKSTRAKIGVSETPQTSRPESPKVTH